LTRIAEEIGRLTELGSFLDHVRGIVRDQLACDAALIWLIDDDGELGPAGYERNSLEQELAAQPPSLAGPLQPITAGDVLRPMRGSSLLRYERLMRPARSAAFVPLVVEDRPIGYLEVTSREPERFRDAEHQLLQAIASQVAPTVRVAQLHDLVKRAADTDGLTGVLNHRAFYRELDAALIDADATYQLFVLIIDVVGLKAVNDTYGHVAGDQALRSIAAALRARLRPHDVLARYGGDEFAAIVRHASEAEVDVLVARVEGPISILLDDGRALTIQLRCGHASLTDSERRATELVARADALLYRLTGPTMRQDARVQPGDQPGEGH
jgi:diguanylate cyclase (GGDEF)-like protein